MRGLPVPARPGSWSREGGLSLPRPLLDLLLPLACLGLGLVLRLANLGQTRAELSENTYDEGIRLAQLALMEAGYRPFRDIYASQGPLLLDYFYLFYDAFGANVAAARLGAVVGSLAGLAGIYLAGRRLWGRPAGLLALLFLAVSPLFLQVSRQALAEAPSASLATLAFWAALVYRDTGRTIALLATVASLALAILLKPFAGVVAVPILLVVAPAARHWSRRIWMAVGLGALVGALLTVWYVGPSELVEYFVLYRVGALGLGTYLDEPWTLGGNLMRIRQQITWDLPWVAAAVFGSVALLRREPARAGAPVAWFLATLVVLLFYSPLSWKHVAYLLPPASLLAAGALVELGRAIRAARQRGIAFDLLPVGLALGLLVVWAPLMAQVNVGRIFNPPPAVQPGGDLADALALLDDVTPSDTFLVTDHPYLAYLGNRLVPPRLADPSRTRVRSGSLQDEEAIRETARYAPAAVVIWAYRFPLLYDYAAWLPRNYVLVRQYERNQAVYLRPDLAAGLGPTSLGRPVWPGSIRFGNQLELLGARVEARLASRQTRLSFTLRPLMTVHDSFILILDVQDPAGEVVLHRELDLRPSWHPLEWPAGEVVDLRRQISLPDGAPGAYRPLLRVRSFGRDLMLAPAADPRAPVSVESGAVLLEPFELN